MNREAQVLAMFKGKPRELEINGKTTQTGMYKSPVSERTLIHKLGFGDDFIGHLSVHGGELQAIYIYSLTAYEPWKSCLSNEAFKWGLFGENILVDRLDEAEVYIGDKFRLGEATLQATAPRYPCGIFQSSTGYSQTIKMFCDLQRPGVYFKVLQEGHVQKGDVLTFIEHQDRAVSIQRFFIDYDQARKGVGANILPSRLSYYLNNELVPKIFKERLQKSLSN